MPITRPTGAEVVEVRTSTDQAVGAYVAADIDADYTTKTPNSPTEESAAWINALVSGLGTLSTEQTLYATRAMLWHCWLYYWKLSRYGDNCPAECSDEKSFFQKESFATKEICRYLTLLGVNDETICGSVEAGTRPFTYSKSYATELN
jgi:hypothetical protein